MADNPEVHKTFARVIQATRIVIRCLTSGRDSQESSQRAVLILVDILDLLYRIKDQAADGWATVEEWYLQKQEPRRRDLHNTLKWFDSTLRTIELYFQPGGVSVYIFRKQLLDSTFLPQLEQYKILFLLWMQPDSCERAFIEYEIRDRLSRSRDAPANLKSNLEFEEDALGLTSRLASEHFITLADLCNRRQQGSCRWVFENSEYKQWLLGSSRTLYCVGPPGAGKTFLSSVIIDSLQRTFISPDVATIYLFCQNEMEKGQTSIDLLRNILAQLVYRKRSLSSATSSLYYFESLTKERASTKAYQNAIRAEVSRFSKVFVVVDGLDMLPDKERLISRLQRLPEHAQLLVTLRHAPPVVNNSYMEVRASAKDLQYYALSHLQSDLTFKDLFQENGSRGYEFLRDVVRTLVDRSHGVFLLAKIHLELLSKYTDRTLMGRALHHLPQSLSETYGEAMKQVVSVNPRATRYIYWTLYALRPLSVTELQSATQTADFNAEQEQMSFEQSLQIHTGGLLTVDAVAGTVRFIHRTVDEYLRGAAARVFFPYAQKDIAETCLTAITPDEVVDDCYVSSETKPRNTSKGFTSYAAMYWGYHAREVSGDEQTIHVLVKTFLNKFQWRRPPLQNCGETKRLPTELGLGKYPEDWSALHILAFFGIVGKSKRLLEQGAKADANDNSLMISPLHCAASQGNDEVVELLLNNGVDGNASCIGGNTALHMATQRGHRRTMKLLLSQPVNAQIANHQGMRSLQLAVGTTADEATVPTLVKHGAGINSRNLRTGDTTLHLAVEWRRPRIILYLLEKGAALDIHNEDGLNPLQLAAKIDNCEAISLLLQKGAQVDSRSLSGRTALQIAFQKRNWIAFDLLVIGGADLNAWVTNGETLLHEQAKMSFSNVFVAAKLLDHGANVETRSSQGYTALQCAAQSGNKTMFMFLLSHGAKTSVLTRKGESLLHITPPLNNDYLDILKAALDHGVNANTVSSQGWTPLHQTVYMGTSAPDLESDKTRDYIDLLLFRSADITAYTVSAVAETPLHLATRANMSRPALVSLLLALGAKINALTSEGKTPLHLAGERGRESIFRILLDAGADLFLELPNSHANRMNNPDTPTKSAPLDKSAPSNLGDDVSVSTGSTAFDLARKNPFNILWFDDEGKMRPTPERKRRDSVETIIDEIEVGPDEVNDETMTGSTLVDSEKRFVLV